MVFLGLSSSLFDVTILHLIYSSYYDIYMCCLFMSKTHKLVFYYMCYIHSLSNGVILNPIISSFISHPTQDPYLCYAKHCKKNNIEK